MKSVDPPACQSRYFVGPTTMYAFMQAMGLVNDHIKGCAARLKVTAAREEFKSSAAR